MPDSLPPIQGPASQGERDLDWLLSGEEGYPAVALGPVGKVLGALRGTPTPDELDGEAAARAAFRLFVLPEVGSPAGARAGLHRAVPSAGPRHRRARRRVPRPERWQVMAVAGSAAAVVIIGAAALAGAFSGLGGHQGPAGHKSSSQTAADTSGGHATSPVLEGGGHSVSPARPTQRAGSQQSTAASPQQLCHQYMDFFTHAAPPASWPAERSVIEQLSKLAGGMLRINAYCDEQFRAAGSGPDQEHQGGGDQSGRGGPDGSPPRLSGAESSGNFGGR